MVGGATNREHYQAAQKHSVRARQMLVDPVIPPGCAHVWTYFCELNEVRGGTTGPAGWVPNPISFTEIDSWARLTRRAPGPNEIAMLRCMDRLWLAGGGEVDEAV